MAALNRDETNALRVVIANLKFIEKKIRAGEKLSEQDAGVIKNSHEAVNTVVQMKGHYNK